MRNERTSWKICSTTVSPVTPMPQGICAQRPATRQIASEQVDVEVDRRPEALDQREGAAQASVTLELSVVQQMPLDHTLHHLQHRRDRLELRGQQHAQRDRQGQHPMPHRHTRDDVLHQVCRRLRHAPHTARGA